MKRKLLEVRASALPLAFTCPGSAQPPTVPAADASYPARLGSAVHQVLRGLAETGQVPWTEVNGAADRWGVSADEVSVLCGLAQKLWPSIAASFPEAISEVPLSAEISRGLMLTGTADLVSVRGRTARILDWKTGRKDRNYAHQVKGYAALVLAEDHELDSASATIVWLRDQAIENYTMTRAAMTEWASGLAEQLLSWDGIFHPGGHCMECPRSHECAAANALVRRDISMFSSEALAASMEADLAKMAPADVIELLRKADTVAYFAGRVRSAVKAHVLANGDIVGDGSRLTIESQDRRELDPIAAWPVLEAAGLTGEELAACVDVHISRIEGTVAKKAGRGKGAAAVRELTAKLEEATAVHRKQTQILKEKRT